MRKAATTPGCGTRPLPPPCLYRPAVVVSAHDSTARAELIRGVRGMLGKTLRIDTRLPQENAVLLGTADEIWASRALVYLADRHEA